MPDLHETINQFLEGSIASIGRDPVIESKSITANGTYTAPEGVDGYSPVVVNVPSDEPVIESKTITENGTYTPESGVDGFAPVVVNVPPTEPVIESKNISENGTYTAPEGVDGYSPVVVSVPEKTLTTKSITANGTYNASADNADGYSQVSVNVPLPSNAYLLKSVPNLPQAIASFNDGADMVMPSLKVAIEPVQEGSGDPSPTNVRPISGWSGANVVVSHTTDAEDGQTYTIDLDGTRYGGTLDVVSGVLMVDRAEIDLGSRTYNKANDGYFYAYISDISIMNFNANAPTAECEIYKLCTSDEWYGRTIDSGIFGVESSHVMYVADSRFSDGNSLKTALAGKKLVYTLATPLTIQLTPTAVKSLRGVNNVYANTGDIKDAEYFSKEE